MKDTKTLPYRAFSLVRSPVVTSAMLKNIDHGKGQRMRVGRKCYFIQSLKAGDFPAKIQRK